MAAARIRGLIATANNGRCRLFHDPSLIISGMQSNPIVVLVVCTGNICRSPTGEGVLRALVERRGLSDRIEVRSAGTHDYHVGEGPDTRSVRHAKKRGYDLSPLRA